MKFALIGRLEISAKFHNEIFGVNAPLSSFSNKVRFAHSINLISDETRKTIDLIRKIRNAFAHSKRPIFFTTEEIVDACSLFDVPIPLPPTTGQKEAEQTLEKMPPARQKFQNTCQIIMHNLFVVVGMYYPFPPQAPRTA